MKSEFYCPKITEKIIENTREYYLLNIFLLARDFTDSNILTNKTITTIILKNTIKIIGKLISGKDTEILENINIYFSTFIK